ncbi:MAG: adenine deaminase C-terminal domain-containing protein [Pseudomonadales bacterium]|jgi:adenine deaminase
MKSVPEGAAVGAHLAPDAKTLKLLRAVALGDEPADLIVRDARVLSVHTGEILRRDVVVSGAFVAAVTPVGHCARGIREEQADGAFLAPTLIDTHVHIEYSLLTPGEFARCVIPRGTGCVLADPNCIGNVLGAGGMDWVGETGTPLKILQQVSHRIPRAPALELGGATLTESEQVQRLLSSRAVTVGESVPFGFDDRAATLQALALQSGRRNTGHSARVSEELLWAYAATGISDDHNAFHTEEVLERIRLGMMITVMAGSMNDNVPMVFAKPEALSGGWGQFSFCADDRHVDDLHRRGHIDHHVRAAIAAGVPVLEAYRMASLNAAVFYRIDHLIGSVTPTRRADFMLLTDLERVEPFRVFLDGQQVAESTWPSSGAPLSRLGFKNRDPIPDMTRNTMHLDPGISAASFRVEVESAPGEVALVRAMEMYDGYFKRAFDVELSIVDGDVCADPERDVAKIAVLDRHHGSATRACGFVRGFGLRSGAIAASTNCENQNLVVLGTSNSDMAAAAIALRESGGGYVAVRDGVVLALLPLPVAGIMSDQPFEWVLEQSDLVNAAARSLGCELAAPFMILAFVGLAGVPDYGLTERGLIDSASQTFIPLVHCCRCPSHVHDPMERAFAANTNSESTL